MQRQRYGFSLLIWQRFSSGLQYWQGKRYGIAFAKVGSNKTNILIIHKQKQQQHEN